MGPLASPRMSRRRPPAKQRGELKKEAASEGVKFKNDAIGLLSKVNKGADMVKEQKKYGKRGIKDDMRMKKEAKKQKITYVTKSRKVRC